MLFTYKAKTKEDRLVEGTVEAAHEAMAIELLEERGLAPLFVQVKRRSLFNVTIPFLTRVSAKEITAWSRQLSVMVSANLPIVEAVRTLSNQSTNTFLAETLRDVADDVEGGTPFSSALAKHPKVFSDFFVNMARSGETGGRLDEVLSYLADQQEKDYELTSKIKGAMMYPAFILSGLLVVGFIMMTFVVPKMTVVLQESGATLPFTTRMLIGTSNFFAAWWWAVLCGAVVAIIAFIQALRTERGRLVFDTIILRVPVFGALFGRIYLVRFTRSLSTLLAGGVPMTQSLEIVADVVGSTVFRGLVLETARKVRDGHSLTSVFVDHPVFPAMATQMLSTGERTGKIDTILDRLSDFYTREIDTLVQNMVSLIEPMIMVLMGLAVGAMVSAIILPMYNLANEL